jgi:hypothetical protein
MSSPCRSKDNSLDAQFRSSFTVSRGSSTCFSLMPTILTSRSCRRAREIRKSKFGRRSCSERHSRWWQTPARPASQDGRFFDAARSAVLACHRRPWRLADATLGHYAGALVAEDVHRHCEGQESSFRSLPVILSPTLRMAFSSVLWTLLAVIVAAVLFLWLVSERLALGKCIFHFAVFVSFPSSQTSLSCPACFRLPA